MEAVDINLDTPINSQGMEETPQYILHKLRIMKMFVGAVIHELMTQKQLDEIIKDTWELEKKILNQT